MKLEHRQYEVSDRDACIAIFHTNVPRYMRDFELGQFTEFLDSDSSEYVVVIADDEMVGCGGYGLDDEGDTAGLCWGLVRQEQHGKRLGEYLLLIRLHAIATTTEAKYVRLGTCQLTEGFFERYGFETQSTKRDGIAEGLDEVEMRLELTDENRAMIERKWRAMSGR